MTQKLMWLYTDGSCHPQLGIGAWAAIVVANNTVVASLCQASKPTNHQRMELEAVINGLSFIHNNYPLAPVQVITDSQYIVGLLRRQEKLEKTNFITKANNTLHNSDLIILFYKTIKTMQVHFEKIKAHQSDETTHAFYNKQADILCRQKVRDEAKNTKLK